MFELPSKRVSLYAALENLNSDNIVFHRGNTLLVKEDINSWRIMPNAYYIELYDHKLNETYYYIINYPDSLGLVFESKDKATLNF